MADASFGHPWPACDGPHVTLVRADGLRIVIHRELVDLVAMLMDLTELDGYDIVPGQTWGFACRPIRGTQRPSNHSTATAIDVNSLANPQRRPLTTNLPRKVRELWKGHGFRWGGDYVSSTPDPMHFEFMGSVADARTITKRLRDFLKGAGHAAPPPPAPPVHRPGRPTWRAYPGPARMGDGSVAHRSNVVKVWQGLLRDRGYSVAADGIFREATNHVVMDWQRKHGLKVDGIAGSRTWNSLLFT